MVREETRALTKILVEMESQMYADFCANGFKGDKGSPNDGVASDVSAHRRRNRKPKHG